MEIYIVFEYAEHTNKIVGCYKNEEDANRKHDESPTWRYIEKQKLLWNRKFKRKMEVNDMDFEELIGEALEEMQERNERVMKNFFYRIGYKGIVGYENDLGKKVFTVWTDKPGILIGKGGQNVEILKGILKEEFDHDYEIEFKEIKGKMLVIL